MTAPHKFATETKCDCMHRLIADSQHIANTMKTVASVASFAQTSRYQTHFRNLVLHVHMYKVASVKQYLSQPIDARAYAELICTYVVYTPIDCMLCLTTSKHELCYCDPSTKLDQRYVYRSCCNLVLHSKGHVDGAVNLQRTMQ